MLSREKFVQICVDEILAARKNIAIVNQVSGYKKYHSAIREEKYFSKFRSIINKKRKRDGYSIFFQHDITKHARVAHCREIAEYLGMEILEKISALNADAKLNIVSSTLCDHVYLHIDIQLQDERDRSLWEVDAWDPRIIDVSQRPDGSRKNADVMGYGETPKIKFEISVDEVKQHKFSFYFFKFEQPVEGELNGGMTPEYEIIEKYAHIYDDYTLEEAFAEGKLPEKQKLEYLQTVSRWQKL